MSLIGTALLDLVRTIERPGAYCVGALHDVIMPAIDVDGVGRIGFPVSAAQAMRLIEIAEPAPYGRGQETLVDPGVRRTWQIDTDRVTINGRRWNQTLADLVAETATGLGISDPVEAEFYKLLIYDAGSFFVDHRDTEKSPGMFATMVLVLPSAHSGGELVVRHLGREAVFDLLPDEPSQIGCAAFYADCVHEVRPVTDGVRLTLIYNLRFSANGQSVKAPDYRRQHAELVALLRRWADTEDEPDKLIVPLEHAYTVAELSFGALKGADAGAASVLAQAAAEAECDLHLALISIEESGIAEYDGDYRRGGWRHRDEDDDDEFEAGEVTDRALTLSAWCRTDGGEAELGALPFSEEELCPPDAFEDLTPDDEHFREATGNEGASFERSYSRAGLVLWPAARRLAVLNHGGLATTLPYLEGLAQRWERADPSVRLSLWTQADELSGRMLWTWPRVSWRPSDDDKPGRMLDVLCCLANLDRIDQFLTDLSAAGHYAAIDNAAIVRAASLLPGARATERLTLIVSHNMPRFPGACGDLLRRCVEADGWSRDELAPIGLALVNTMPSDEAVAARVGSLQPEAPRVPPDFVVDLLTASSQIDTALAERAVGQLLGHPKRYDLDDVLVPAACVLARLAESRSWPAVTRLGEACLQHLRQRVALPLAPPQDWTRPNPLRCTCADCQDLAKFLLTPDQKQWRLKAVQDRRGHVEQTVRSARCDLDLVTEKRGSPHSLVATKNQASYERRVRQRREDLAHIATLTDNPSA